MVSRVKPVWRALIGLQAGVVAGAVMFLYLVLDAGLRDASVWSTINLFSSNFHGSAALGLGFRRTSIAGLAWLVGSSGLLGLGISILLHPFVSRPTRCSLVGALLALGWYYTVVRGLWPLWNPLAVRQPFPGLMFAHLVFGVAMGMYPRFLAAFESHGMEEQPDGSAGGAA
jgi:hypothetical protein